MSSLLSSLGCCFWWLLFGVLIGWLLNRCLRKCCDAKASSPATPPSPPPVAKTSEMSAITPVAKASPAAKPETATKPKPATKSKATMKPKAATKQKISAKAKTPTKTTVIDLAAAKAAGFTLKNANDLTVIEGIGPKINELFVDNGLKTFSQVAVATVPQMRAILDKGGSRFRIANPSTWAKQAALAADNKWAALKKLQDELSGGIKK